MAGGLSCWSCGEPNPADANWCEACGESTIEPPDPCVSCGADGADVTDGYCGTCGHKQPDPRDHVIVDLGPVAAVSDKGKRHHRNEDAVSIVHSESGTVIVVCDGVSSTVASETASQAAADVATSRLAAGLASGEDHVEALGASAAAAQQAVIDAPAPERRGDPPSCTFVGAVTTGGSEPSVTVGWLGDSRAYLVSNGIVTQLTADDSWAKVQVAEGLLDEEAAQADPRAHSITRWLGEDATDVVPRTSVIDASAGDLLVVCTDGLWNYAPTEADLSDVIGTIGTIAPLELATELVDFALAKGGHDNVTVAVAVL